MYCFGLGGYLYAQDETKGSILLNCNNFRQDFMFLVGADTDLCCIENVVDCVRKSVANFMILEKLVA